METALLNVRNDIVVDTDMRLIMVVLLVLLDLSATLLDTISDFITPAGK